MNDQIVRPKPRLAPVQHADLPSEIRADYDEAAAIVDDSPRGAAALLCLAMEKLCARLGSKDRKLDQNIGHLVSKGLDPTIQRAIDTVRVTRNEAAHPGTMDLRDDRDTVFSLFSLINIVVEEMNSRPEKIRQMYDALPEGKRQGIANRSGGSAAS